MVAFKLWLLSFVLVVGGLVGIQGTKYYGNLEGRHATLCTGGTLTLECAPSNGVPRVITILSDWNLTRSNCPERCCPSTTDPNVNVYRTKEGVEIQREAVLEVNNILSNCRYVDKCRYSLTEDDDLWFEKQQGDSDKMLYLSFYYVCVPAISKGQECYIDDLKRAYTGRLDQSREGTTCERWSTVIDVVSNYITPLWFPDTLTDNGYDLNKVENFCRNPGQLKDLYCFVNVALPGANPDYQIIWCDLPNRCKVKYVDEQQLVGPQSDNEEGGSSSQILFDDDEVEVKEKVTRLRKPATPSEEIAFTKEPIRTASQTSASRNVSGPTGIHELEDLRQHDTKDQWLGLSKTYWVILGVNCGLLCLVALSVLAWRVHLKRTKTSHPRDVPIIRVERPSEHSVLDASKKLDIQNWLLTSRYGVSHNMPTVHPQSLSNTQIDSSKLNINRANATCGNDSKTGPNEEISGRNERKAEDNPIIEPDVGGNRQRVELNTNIEVDRFVNDGMRNEEDVNVRAVSNGVCTKTIVYDNVKSEQKLNDRGGSEENLGEIANVTDCNEMVVTQQTCCDDNFKVVGCGEKNLNDEILNNIEVNADEKRCQVENTSDETCNNGEFERGNAQNGRENSVREKSCSDESTGSICVERSVGELENLNTTEAPPDFAEGNQSEPATGFTETAQLQDVVSEPFVDACPSLQTRDMDQPLRQNEENSKENKPVGQCSDNSQSGPESVEKCGEKDFLSAENEHAKIRAFIKKTSEELMDTVFF